MQESLGGFHFGCGCGLVVVLRVLEEVVRVVFHDDDVWPLSIVFSSIDRVSMIRTEFPANFVDVSSSTCGDGDAGWIRADGY